MSDPAARLAAVEAVVTAVRPAGNLDVVTLSVPDDDAWERARPGQLVVVPRDPALGAVLPEVHWLAGAHVDPIHGASIELMLPLGRATEPGERIRLLGPLGRGFAPPSQQVPVLLVGHEGGAVPLHWLVAILRARGCTVHVLLGSSDPQRHVDLVHLRRHARTVVLTLPEDLSASLERMLDDHDINPAVVYACAPVPILREIATAGVARGLAVRVAALDLDQPVVCGTGLCGACDLEVHDGRSSRVLRACLEGPVVPGDWLVGGMP